MIFMNEQNFGSVFSLIYFTLNFAGGYREVEIPSPIPNLEVKHFIADNTAGSPGGNVGRCQLLSIASKKVFHLFQVRIFTMSLALNIFSCLVLSFFFTPIFYLSLSISTLKVLLGRSFFFTYFFYLGFFLFEL